jgi:hypothetical protein
VPESLGSSKPKDATIAPASHQNAGNWICEFQASDIGISEPKFQVYHIVVDGGPIGGKFTYYHNNVKYGSVFPGWDTEWDPNNPMKLNSGDTVYFWWNTGVGDPAEVTLFFEKETVV